MAEERVANRFAVLLRDSATAFQQAGPIWSQRYLALLPVRTQLVLAWTKLRSPRTFFYGPYGGYAALSLLKLLPLFLVIAGCAGWAIWTRTLTYQVDRITALAPQIRTSGLDTFDAVSWVDSLALSGRLDDAYAQALSAPARERRAQMLTSVAQRMEQRGQIERASTVLKEAVSAVQGTPENERLQACDSIVRVAATLARAGAGDQAAKLLDNLTSNGLETVPEGNNRAAVAINVARLYRKLGHSGEADKLLVNSLPQMNDGYTLPSAVVEFHRLGDEDHASQLIAKIPKLPPIKSMSNGDDAVQLIVFADMYRLSGRSTKASEAYRRAIDHASAMKPGHTREGTRQFEQYFLGYYGAYFAKYLVRGGQTDVVTTIANREGDILERLEILTAAAGESHRIGHYQEVDPFLKFSGEQARAVMEPSLRARALMILADEYVDIGDKVAAEATLREALPAVRAIPETYVSTERFDGKTEKLSQMLAVTLRLDDLHPNPETQRLALESELRSRTTATDPSTYLPEVSKALALNGEFRLARIVAERSTGGGDQLKAFAATMDGITFHFDPELEHRIEEESRAVDRDQE
jgi:tetratricopeptide (TPR) repeat protein